MRAAWICLLPLFAVACQTPMTLPPDFVQLRDAGEGFRAITSDDARVWVRNLYDDTEANVDFWTTTLQRDFVDQRGYQLVGSGDTKNAAGETGRWLEFHAAHDGEAIGYLVAVWVHGRRLQVVEFAARTEVFTKRVDAVRAALTTVR